MIIKSTLASALFLASLAGASTAVAGDIRKCVSAEGRVTLTDDACPGDTRKSQVIISQEAPALAVVPAAAPEPLARPIVSRMPPRFVNVARSTPAERSVSLDRETLRTARVKLNVADALRSQRMASLQ